MKNQSVLYYLDLQLFAEDQTPADDITPPADQNAVDALKKLKENTVPKADYLKVVQENKELWEAALNGKQQSQDEDDDSETPDIKSLREELYGGKELSNLEYCKKTLELRKALMEQGETDPFLPVGKKVTPDDNDIAAAEKVATVIQECIDYANGDSEVFTNELQRRTIDVSISRR